MSDNKATWAADGRPFSERSNPAPHSAVDTPFLTLPYRSGVDGETDVFDPVSFEVELISIRPPVRRGACQGQNDRINSSGLSDCGSRREDVTATA